MTEPFLLKLKLSFSIGLIGAVPLIVLQIWGFIVPGLRPSERKPIARMAPFSLVLFLIGAGFCWMILPAALQWFGSYIAEYPGTGLIQEPGTMAFFILKMMLAFGVGFQLPLVVYALGALDLLTAETLIQYWRQSVIVIFFAAAALTPSNDPTSMLMMAVPLVLLFMISVWFVKLTQRKKRKREAEEDTEEDAYDESA